MATTQSTKRKTAATRRSTTAKKAAATRARRTASTEASRVQARANRSRTGAGRQGDTLVAQVELAAAKAANLAQGVVTGVFKGAAAVFTGVRRAL
jgi:hypothetical protein